MIKRVHFGVFEAVLFGVAVPAFPHSRRPVFKHVTPGRIFFFCDEFICKIGFADIAKGGKNKPYSYKARSQTAFFPQYFG